MERTSMLLDADFILGFILKIVGLIALFAVIYISFKIYRIMDASAPTGRPANGFVKSINFVKKLLFGCDCDRVQAPTNY